MVNKMIKSRSEGVLWSSYLENLGSGPCGYWSIWAAGIANSKLWGKNMVDVEISEERTTCVEKKNQGKSCPLTKQKDDVFTKWLWSSGQFKGKCSTGSVRLNGRQVRSP